MQEIVCTTCNKQNNVEAGNPGPFECSFCFDTLPAFVVSSISPDRGNEAETPSQVVRYVSGLELVYQIDQRRIQLGISEKTILGRSGYGADVLSTILYNGEKVISRNHCSIEYRDGDFFIRDENSKNGTFYGVKKISCRNSPQLIEHNSLIYLGEEPFVAQIIQRVKEIEAESTEACRREETGPVGIYRCNDCGFETTEKLPECPKCNTRKSFSLILKEKEKVNAAGKGDQGG
ncbi:MAG: FHA domain-containing protein [Chloracidobacterium sp.]|nr:FHA domain-containing protein [Chloracidobacterium sp.]